MKTIVEAAYEALRNQQRIDPHMDEPTVPGYLDMTEAANETLLVDDYLTTKRFHRTINSVDGAFKDATYAQAMDHGPARSFRWLLAWDWLRLWVGPISKRGLFWLCYAVVAVSAGLFVAWLGS